MQHPEEGVIHAWLDGELSAEDAAALEAHVAECRECAATVAEARGLIAASSRIVSALDIVPGDVIPAATPRKRAWYANTQLRAAAAVLVVAGASLIVMKRDGAPDMERVMSKTASTPMTDSALPQTPSASEGAATAPVEAPPARPAEKVMLRAPTNAPAPTATASAPAADAAKERDVAAAKKPREDEEVKANEMSRKVADNAVAPKEALTETALQGKVAGVTAAVLDTLGARPLAKARSSAEKPQPARLRALSAPLDQVVVTGVATATTGLADEAGLREMKSDTTANTVVTIYQVSPGVQVTLIELLPPAFAAQRRDERRDERQVQKQSAATGNAAILPAAPVASASVKIETITWTNASSGRTYTLSGPLSKEQLTALRKRLPPARR